MQRYLQISILIAIGIGFASVFALGPDQAVRHFTISIVVPLVLLGLACLQRSHGERDKNGWNCLTASHMHMASFVMCALLSGVLAYVYLFVGSSRADAEQQMTILLGLLSLFGLGTIYLFIECFIVHVRWNSTAIEYWLGPLKRRSIAWDDLTSVKVNQLSGSVRLFDHAGQSIPLDIHRNGAQALAEEVANVMRQKQSGPWDRI